MKPTLKQILLATSLILAIVCLFLFRSLKQTKADFRVQVGNVKDLLAENTHRNDLILTLKQAQGISKLKLDSLSKALQIKPKTIIRTIEKTVEVHDTIIEKVQVLVTGKDKWKIFDSDKCWTWQGIAYLYNDSLKIDRISFDYENKSTDIYYQVRKHKFMFIRFGKKQTFVKSSSECGEEYTREIIIDK